MVERSWKIKNRVLFSMSTKYKNVIYAFFLNLKYNLEDIANGHFYFKNQKHTFPLWHL